MKENKKPFYSINKSKEHEGKFRIVQWIGVHPNITIKTILDDVGYGEATIKLEEIKNK